MKQENRPLMFLVPAKPARVAVTWDEGQQVREGCERAAAALSLEAGLMPECEVQVLMEELATQFRRRARLRLVSSGQPGP